MHVCLPCLRSKQQTEIEKPCRNRTRSVIIMQGLEERFLGLIEPKLAAALSQKNGERVQQLSSMLMGIQCYGTVEKLYNTARMAPLQV